MAASLRTRYTVAWAGGDPVEVLTTVTDLINAVDSIAPESGRNKVALETLLIYSALRRSPDHQVPAYEEWLEVLDSYGEIPNPAAGNGEGPTPAASPTEQSSSPASPEPTGDPGWDPTLPSLTTPAP